MLINEILYGTYAFIGFLKGIFFKKLGNVRGEFKNLFWEKTKNCAWLQQLLTIVVAIITKLRFKVVATKYGLEKE